MVDYNLGNNRSIQSVAHPYGVPVTYDQASEWIEDAEVALQHIEYTGCFVSDKFVEAEFTSLTSEFINPSTCADLCVGNSDGRDFEYFLLGYKEFDDDEVRVQ